MNSPLQPHKVRLRGLGGQAVYGVSRTCASATRRLPKQIFKGHDSPLEIREVRLRGAFADCTGAFAVAGQATRPGE